MERVVIALLAGKRLGRSFKIVLRQQRREKPVARRIADTDALCRCAETFAQARSLRRRAAERPHHLPGIEPEQLAATRRRAEHPAGRRDMPAAIVMARRDRKPDPAFDLLAEHES